MAQRRRSWRVWCKRAAVLAAVLGVVGAVALYLLAQHLPSWYRPQPVPPAQLPRLRSEVTRLIDDISDALATGRTIDLTFTSEQLNAFLAALPELWPDAARNVPPQLHQPLVQLQTARVRLAVLYEGDRAAAVLSATLAVTLTGPDGELLELRIGDPRLGSLPVPAGALTPWLAEQPLRLGQRVGPPHTVADLFTGVEIPNRFTWPNGRRSFRIDALDCSPTQLHIRLEPFR